MWNYGCLRCMIEPPLCDILMPPFQSHHRLWFSLFFSFTFLAVPSCFFPRSAWNQQSLLWINKRPQKPKMYSIRNQQVQSTLLTRKKDIKQFPTSFTNQSSSLHFSGWGGIWFCSLSVIKSRISQPSMPPQMSKTLWEARETKQGTFPIILPNDSFSYWAFYNCGGYWVHATQFVLHICW